MPKRTRVKSAASPPPTSPEDGEFDLVAMAGRADAWEKESAEQREPARRRAGAAGGGGGGSVCSAADTVPYREYPF
jgi:hypothetical protein